MDQTTPRQARMDQYLTPHTWQCDCGAIRSAGEGCPCANASGMRIHVIFSEDEVKALEDAIDGMLDKPGRGWLMCARSTINRAYCRAMVRDAEHNATPEGE